MAPLKINANIFMALLFGVLIIIFNLESALASSSGGVVGGSFFHDSDDESFKNEHSDPHHEHYYSPPSHHHDTDEHANHGSGGGPMILFLFFSFGLFLVGFCKDKKNGNSTTVLKLQVAMMGGKGSSIQRDLTRIAETADTSSAQGVSYLLKEIILTLQQNPGYCIAAYSSVDLMKSREDGEKCYNQISLEERAKFVKETLVNLNGKEKLYVKKSRKEEALNFEEKLLNGFGKEYIVITILVAAKGLHKLPSMNGAKNLHKALDMLGSIISTNLLAGEVLWTPQKEDDTLSERELHEDYPQLAKAMKSLFP